ncbi:hypothetical protein LGL55_05055 [Clostridium tagluense]|uniref:hypothetical protein n=1 Tax=Clostridium tagluense TaxID=360422 RepID=UPI001C0C6663|nr:hypothetical protein [Clostridium tagluense]MBU3126812.1 hypothetical protein [Clostridium tagluense]MCB2310488.1 hypothetical protein [Clostridium tagluense]MCB2315346.1 hypothetical protein [Clostridium tagluense]MCB2320197.1 hypothetical protein [Clostridium tagluense]MCB2325088.1 hypothetical protein [Clostridium tagluense]
MEIIEIIKERLSIFKNLYDTVRIVNPNIKKIVNFGEDNTEIAEGSCFDFWKTDGFCNNCIAMKSCLENDTFIKMEISDGKIFIIISSPVTIENKVYIVEMIKDISQTGSIMNNEKNINNIKSLIKEINDADIMDELTGLYNKK